jgi:hypothetical protein
MPSYAVLGATGNTGLCLVQILLHSRQKKQINAYCRSSEKLFRLCPEAANNPNVKVFEGTLDDQTLLTNCLRGTRAAFLAVAQSDNVPYTTVARDTAKSAIAALRVLRDERSPLPKLVVLSSGSLEPKFSDDVPKWVHSMLWLAASHVYHDLQVAEAMLRDEQTWISDTTWIKPGALSHDTQKGHALSQDSAKSPVSWLDLAAGMVEVANEDTQMYAMANVAVNPTAKDVAFPWYAPIALFRGLLFHFLPWTYKYLG